ncbi:hypothetical protein MRX96_035948 [Rhipicephalus microplus]
MPPRASTYAALMRWYTVCEEVQKEVRGVLHSRSFECIRTLELKPFNRYDEKPLLRCTTGLDENIVTHGREQDKVVRPNGFRKRAARCRVALACS